MERFSEVNPDLLRGGEPTAEDLRILANVWGVKRIVSLDKRVGLAIAPVCAKLGLEQLIIPISGGGDIVEVLDYLKINIVALLTGKKPTYVHCKFGRDRTGLAVALYRIQAEGWEPDEAYREALSFDFGDGLSKENLELFEKYLLAGKKLKTEDETVETDISQLARQSLETHPETDGSYFSPIAPGDMQNANDRRKRKRQLRKLVWQDLNDAMAYVGVNEGVSPISHNVNKVDHTPHPTLPYGYSYIL